MNNYAILNFDNISTLFRFDGFSSRSFKHHKCLSGSIKNAIPLSSFPEYLEIKDGKCRDWRFDSLGFKDLTFYIEDGDYLFEAENDDAARLIYEVGGYE